MLTRRSLLTIGGAALLASGLGACGSGSGSGGAELQFAWWGNDERDRRTKSALDAYHKKHPKVTIRPQITGWDGYWAKLATQTAGSNPPDLIQMDYAYITAYAGRGALLALDDYVPDALRIGDFGKQSLAPGRIDGKLFGVNWGVNALAMMVNEAVLRDVGLDVPDESLTWSEFAALTAKVAAKSPNGVFGTENAMLGSIDTALQCWLRERGKDLYVDDGSRLAFEPADLDDWFGLWEGMVRSGAAATPSVQRALSDEISDGLVARGKAAFGFAWSNQLTAYTEAAKDPVAIHRYPQGDGPDAQPGHYYNASMFLSVSAKTDRPDDAVALANALLTEPAIAGELGYERGVPPSKAVQRALLPDATPPEKASAEYIEALAGDVSDPPIPAPDGDAEVRQAYTYAAEQVAFGKASRADAIEKFFTDAQQALS